MQNIVIIIPEILNPPSNTGGFQRTVITSGSWVDESTAKNGFPGGAGGPKCKQKKNKPKMYYLLVGYIFSALVRLCVTVALQNICYEFSRNG